MSAVIETPRAGSPDRAFYTGMALAAVAIVAIGFSPTFYMRGASLPPLAPVLIVHGIIFTAWIALFVAQTTLIAANQRAWHRRLGAVGAVLAAVMVVTMVLASIDSLEHGRTPVPGLDPRSFFAIPARDIATFPLLVAAAVWFRNDAQTHKRLMLIATLSICDAAFGRFPGIGAYGPPGFYALVDLLIVSGMVYDKATRGRVHAAYWWGLGFVVLSQLVFLAISGTPMWLSFADRVLGR